MSKTTLAKVCKLSDTEINIGQKKPSLAADIQQTPETIEKESVIDTILGKDEDDEENKEENYQEEWEEEVLPTFAEFKASNFGRPTKYNEDMPEHLFNYFMKPRVAKKIVKTTSYGKPTTKIVYETEKLPTAEGFCVEQCIGSKTFYRYIENYPDFRHTYELCRKRQKDNLVQNILDGRWGIKSGAFVAINYTDMREKIEDEAEIEDNNFTVSYALKKDRPNPNIIEADYKDVTV